MKDPSTSAGATSAQVETFKLISGTTSVGGLGIYNTFDLAGTGPRGTAGARCPSTAIKN
jgi:hypothetical protein